MALLEISKLEVTFASGRERLGALRGVNLAVEAGSRTAILGESGCGKTVTALSIARLLPSTASVLGGKIVFDGRDMLALSEEELSGIRGSQLCMIFQHAALALNPLYSVGRQIADVFQHHFGGGQKAAWHKAIEVLAATGIPNPQERARDYPHQYSGGMAQRALIAMALVAKPKFLIADEPTSGLDVTTEHQVLELIKRVVGDLRATLLLITHDMAVVSAVCDRVVVMYAGVVMETGTVAQVLEAPANPYSYELIKCFRHSKREQMPFIPGRVPDLREPGQGCCFAPRCPRAEAICSCEDPPTLEIGTGHFSRCHFVEP